MEINNFLYGSTSYWFWIGTVYLVFLTWQDYKRDPITGAPRRLVDDRLNYFMMGSTFALLSHVKRPIWFILSLVLLTVVMGYVLHRFKTVGDADIKTIGWIFYGCAILNIYQLVTFMLLFVVSSAIYAGLKFGVFKYRKPTPFYGVIFICFLVNSLAWGSYI